MYNEKAPYLSSLLGAIGSENMPAIPLNSVLEIAMIPNAEKVKEKLQQLLDY